MPFNENDRLSQRDAMIEGRGRYYVPLGVDATDPVVSGVSVAVPKALTDLDTTTTGAQLNAIQSFYSALPATLATLGLTVSASFDQAEMQSIADKLDALITALQGKAILEAVAGFFLLETGDYFLLETGDKLILE